MSIRLQYKPVKLELKYPFGISREIKYDVTNVFTKLTYSYKGKEYSGYGEAAPSKFYGESAGTIVDFLNRVSEEKILATNPFQIAEINKNLNKIRYNAAAKSSIDIALYDLIGKMLDIPAYQHLGVNNRIPQTSYTIDISDLEMILQKTGEALMAGYDVFKVKLGTAIDEEIIFSIRQAAPDVKIRVDANGAWDLKTALKMAKILEHHNVEFLEQPLEAGNIKDLKILRQATTLPIFVDESCISYEQIPELSGSVDGINVKLSKCGGITNALKTLHVARAHHMKVMVGCFLETSLGIAAGALVGTQADFVDLDGCLLIKEDPFETLIFDRGNIKFKDTTGISACDIFENLSG